MFGLCLRKNRFMLVYRRAYPNELFLEQMHARWFVPKMVKNGFYSSFVYWRLIWACLVNNSWRRVKMATHGVPTNLKESRVFP
jgi:hypothetical protein